MDLLLVDTETSGVDPKTDKLIEVAYALYSVTHNAIARAESWLVWAASNEAESVNGIPSTLVNNKRYASSRIHADPRVLHWADSVDAIVAYNSDFDRQWFGDQVRALPWVDAMDFAWPREDLEAQARDRRCIVTALRGQAGGVMHGSIP